MKKIIFLSIIVLFSFPVNKKLTKIESEIEVIGTVVAKSPYILILYSGYAVPVTLESGFLKRFTTADPEQKYIHDVKGSFINLLKDVKDSPVKMNFSKFANVVEPRSMYFGSDGPYYASVNSVSKYVADDYKEDHPKEGTRYIAVANYMPVITANVDGLFYRSTYVCYNLGLDIYQYKVSKGKTKKSRYYGFQEYGCGKSLPSTTLNAKGKYAAAGEFTIKDFDNKALMDSIKFAPQVIENFSKKFKKNFQ